MIVVQDGPAVYVKRISTNAYQIPAYMTVRALTKLINITVNACQNGKGHIASWTKKNVPEVHVLMLTRVMILREIMSVIVRKGGKAKIVISISMTAIINVRMGLDV